MTKKKPTAGTVGLNRKLGSKMSKSIIAPTGIQWAFSDEQIAAFAKATPAWALEQSDGFRGSDHAPVRNWSTTVLEQDGVWVALTRDDVWVDGDVEVGSESVWFTVDGADAIELGPIPTVQRTAGALQEAARLLSIFVPVAP